MAVSLLALPVWLAAATFPWSALPPVWWLTFAAFFAIESFAAEPLRVGALVFVVAISGNPAWRGGASGAATMDGWLAIALAGWVVRPFAVDAAGERAVHRAARWFGAYGSMVLAAWLLAVSREADVLSAPFRADLLAALRGIGRLADQAHPFFGLRRLLDLYEASVVGVAVAAVSVPASERRPVLARTLAALAFAALALGAFQACTGWAVAPFGRRLPDGTWQAIRRVNGTAPDANAFAALVVLTAPVALAALRRRAQRWPAALRIAAPVVAVAVAAWVLAMTGSRAVLAALALQAAWHSRRRLASRGSRLRLALAAIALSGAVLALRLWPVERLPSQPTVARFVAVLRGEPEAHRLVIGRVELWRAAWRAAAEHPFVGVGPGNLYRAMPRVEPTLRAPEAAPLRNAHNQFLQIAAEAGPLALVVFVAMAAIALRALVAGGARAPEAWAGRAFALGMVGEVAMGLVGHPLLVAEHLALVFAILGQGIGQAAADPATIPELRRTRRSVIARLARASLVGFLVLAAGQLLRNVSSPPLITVHGAYAEEWTPDGEVFRWLGPDARLVIDGRRARALGARVSAAEPDVAVRPVSVRAELDGLTEGRVELRDGSPRELAVDLPADAGRATELALRCDRTFRPCEVWATGDCRTLCARLWHVAP